MAAALLAGACAAPTGSAPPPASDNADRPVYGGAELTSPVFDVRCTRPRNDSTASTAEMPSVTLDCLGPGPAVNTADLVGRPSVVNFWASWCGPCRKEMPMLASVAKGSGDAVRFVGINTKDNPDAAADLLQATGVRFEQLYDPGGEVLKQLGTVQGLPITVVLDADGAVTLRNVGEIDEATLRDELDSLP